MSKENKRDENTNSNINCGKVEKITSCAVIISAFIFVSAVSITRAAMGLDVDFGTYAMLCVIMAALHIPKAIYNKDKGDIIFSVIYVILSVMNIIMYFYGLTVGA